MGKSFVVRENRRSKDFRGKEFLVICGGGGILGLVKIFSLGRKLDRISILWRCFVLGVEGEGGGNYYFWEEEKYILVEESMKLLNYLK